MHKETVIGFNKKNKLSNIEKSLLKDYYAHYLQDTHKGNTHRGCYITTGPSFRRHFSIDLNMYI